LKIKRLILPLIAALALLTSVNAESYWLILVFSDRGTVGTGALERIEMESLESCEMEGLKWRKSKFMDREKMKKTSNHFHCVTGK